jgi:hypothetical protein
MGARGVVRPPGYRPTGPSRQTFGFLQMDLSDISVAALECPYCSTVFRSPLYRGQPLKDECPFCHRLMDETPTIMALAEEMEE